MDSSHAHNRSKSFLPRCIFYTVSYLFVLSFLLQVLPSICNAADTTPTVHKAPAIVEPPSRYSVKRKIAQPDVEAVIIRVIDGDSLVVDIPTFPPIIGKNITARVAACDTPEKNHPHPSIRAKAHQAKEFTESLHQ